MYLDVHDIKTKELKGRIYCCHGCGEQSKVRKRCDLPPRWVGIDELYYNRKGMHPSRSGWVVNYYCSSCHSAGVTARTVAATTKKFFRKSKISGGFNRFSGITEGKAKVAT